MNIVQCKMCKKPFHSLGGKMCPDCLKQIDLDFITVRDYIYENHNTRIEKVSEETGVEKSVIMYLLKEGRLTLDNPDSEGMLLCELCKKPVATGRMCAECKEEIASAMDKNVKGSNPPQPEKKIPQAGKRTAKMHTDIVGKRN